MSPNRSCDPLAPPDDGSTCTSRSTAAGTSPGTPRIGSRSPATPACTAGVTVTSCRVIAPLVRPMENPTTPLMSWPTSSSSPPVRRWLVVSSGVPCGSGARPTHQSMVTRSPSVRATRTHWPAFAILVTDAVCRVALTTPISSTLTCNWVAEPLSTTTAHRRCVAVSFNRSRTCGMPVRTGVNRAVICTSRYSYPGVAFRKFHAPDAPPTKPAAVTVRLVVASGVHPVYPSARSVRNPIGSPSTCGAHVSCTATPWRPSSSDLGVHAPVTAVPARTRRFCRNVWPVCW